MTYHEDWKGIIWIQNFVFEDTLKVVGLERGRSAARFVLESVTDNKRYPMFMSGILDILKRPRMVIEEGKIKGYWSFHKKGSNYAVYYLGEE